MSGSSVINDVSIFSPAPLHGWFSTSGVHAIRADNPDGLDSYFSAPIIDSSADLRKVFPQAFGTEEVQVTLVMRLPQGVNVSSIVVTAIGDTGGGVSIPAPEADGEWHTEVAQWTPQKPGRTQILILFRDASSPSEYLGVDIKSITVEAKK
ncbi:MULTISPECIES: hypothetical protein [Pseudomonas fluorescens group]|uniref:Uncharacterized protein n=1 Tax=Pseudomonas fluorescens TaxID=294 RepID=A0A0D0SJH2_PSEFL|nr:MULTISPECIES: hypothetical protein [Pseudomonas fluorescens group]AZE62007.1 hypothetical protein C4K02_3652 [Pseudomonas synxantha]KIR22113.1 hypothetical protein PFLU3_24930 [Pseudomonas fluorescens]